MSFPLPPTLNTAGLRHIHDLAHVNTFHPNCVQWNGINSEEELAFLSRFCFEQPGQELAAVGYVTKEFAQLAELERHVAATMALILAEFQGSGSSLSAGFDLHHALSCFAAEETQHANTFYRWVRELSGFDVKLADNLFAERLALYQRPVAPEIKLAALCCSVYVGESVTVVFEHRSQLLDPKMMHLISQLLYLHDLDEARHIQVDHFVINELIPTFDGRQLAEMRSLLAAHVSLNQELGARFEELVSAALSTTWRSGNLAWEIEVALFDCFERGVYAESGIKTVDDVLTDDDRRLLRRFSGKDSVHG
jgi:hypothetical protein